MHIWIGGVIGGVYGGFGQDQFANHSQRSHIDPMRLRFPALPRPALKTLTYSLMHFAVAITVAYALTRSWHAALAIGMIEPLVQTVAYTLHERAWARAERRVSDLALQGA